MLSTDCRLYDSERCVRCQRRRVLESESSAVRDGKRCAEPHTQANKTAEWFAIDWGQSIAKCDPARPTTTAALEHQRL
ncbi:hypothetical protein Ddc_08920 [Ditylenchus destructor]|nr:hypothetical protein Ddc_08920 [Ditylenchus destructor]